MTSILFLVFFTTGCAWSLIRHPIYGLMMYVAVFYLHPPSRWWGQGWMADIRWAYIAGAVAFVSMIVHWKRLDSRSPFAQPVIWGLLAFVIWIAIQSTWAMDSVAHQDLVSYFAKYLVVAFIIVKSVDSKRNLNLFLWAHVLGCLYLAWVANDRYATGRFEGFGGPGLSEANAAANQLVTGILTGASLFLAGRLMARVGLLAGVPFALNALVTTISRSGFLSLAVGGAIFNYFAPVRFRKVVLLLSILGVAAFLTLTDTKYWDRMDTIRYKGEQVEGVDTGGGRLEIIQAQLRMFEGHLFGCGHRCTAVLAPSYLDQRFLDPNKGNTRSSHNTFMTLLVEQGVPGAAFYLAYLVWTYRALARTWRLSRTDTGFLGAVFPAVAAVLGSLVVGDMFVDFLKHEVRLWFIALLVVVAELLRKRIPEGAPSGSL